MHTTKLLLILLPALLSAAPNPKPDPRAHGDSSDPTNIQVQTLNGPVVGFVEKLDAINRRRGPIEEANIFLGVPFAKPPVGTLRFERPLEPENWTEPLETLDFTAGCVPHHPIASFNYDEDCLYLNVFAPHKKPGPEGYPVLVFIHGGGFCSGSASQFGFTNVSDNFVSQGIVVVTIQYRLGMLGFLSNGDGDLPGNIGLWDQLQAMKWVNKNIDRFGGNKNKITLWGQSAGSVSTSMLSLSKHGRGLFQQMILHSGSPYAHWASNEHVVEMSRDLAKQANCPIDDSIKMKECLQDMDLFDIMDAASEFPLIRDQLAFLNYNPRMDGDFFEKDYPELLKDIPEMPTLMGFNTHEAVFLTIEFPNSLMAFRGGLTIHPEQEKNYTRQTFIDFIRNNAAKGVDELNPDDQQLLAEELIKFYDDDWKNESDYGHYLEQYSLLASDAAFIVPIVWEAKIRALQGSPVYLFQFDHVNAELKKQLPFRAVTHAAEYPYIFGNHMFGTFEFNKQDRKAQKRLVDTFANFVKNGNPDTPQMKWPKVEPGKPIKMGVIKSVPQISVRNDALRRVNFWTDLDKDFEVDIIRGVHKEKKMVINNAVEVKRFKKSKSKARA
ncbi:unnamed protein product [Bursaphelenchus okinawaensis]|uniref:Carboxylic ester hydrolase n=1 Tax=Bursaphelenchus okinawaensis TaxID=465554 RepID=A0A811LD52_9BILA|nr:unnamed protein product [Bursaphelenchus okinawaensis]CAG9120979.1 unnamed protein product [Bursaphelenchus okinawaensis]